MNAKLVFREKISINDPDAIEKLAILSGVFRDDEVPIAKELATENLAKGEEKSGYHFIVCENESGEMMGYICYGPIGCTLNNYMIYWIIVNKAFQGQSIGTLLMQKAEEKMRLKNGRHAYAETSSLPSYEKTRAFYRKNDYEEIAKLKDFYAVGDDQCIYRKIFK